MFKMNIRAAEYNDINGIIDIYSYYVLKSTVTFEIQLPSYQEMSGRLAKAHETHCPFLVCEVDEKIAGFTYASRYRSREGYRYTVEGSIYIASSFQGIGLGSALLQELFYHCKRQGFRQMICVVTGQVNSPSYKFHINNGFTYCGGLKNVGNKFDAFIDTHFFQREI
ncbi:Phosphinothricin N-acetyltransferase [Cedecea lapagei]|uniref:Phosphinothricin N-acetyltransferase n=1 Tax=Cedecea lapagei TaxID=158823 RepID=A0A447UWD9_9ENTR|nr:GNAT family N-acetyltransferase [Cedecea lapagei]VEB94991.1 Phosphinothricin N-acetyltransferase [Cedecea lapagei]